MAPSKKSVIKPISLRQYYEKRNKVLIWHDKGGLGDVLMQRMLFNDFKDICPDLKLHFACLPEYMEAVKDHVYIDKVIDSRNVNIEEYGIHYNTCVSIADRYENNKSPFCTDHRSDIWAKYCGISLKNHDMKFRFHPELLKTCKNNLNKIFNNEKPIVLFAPVSKMAVKTLLPFQIEAVIEETKHVNLIGIHNREILELTKRNIPGIYGSTITEWMSYVACSDYVISVDTATFHMAGGLKKPLVGIFTFADGKVYGKHFDFILVQKHRDNGNWDCGPCFTFSNCPKCKTLVKPCLTELSSDEISLGIREMFKKWR